MEARDIELAAPGEPSPLPSSTSEEACAIAPRSMQSTAQAKKPIGLFQGLPFLLRFEARCKLCNFSLGVDLQMDDQSTAAEAIAVEAVLHNDSAHARHGRPKPRRRSG